MRVPYLLACLPLVAALAAGRTAAAAEDRRAAVLEQTASVIEARYVDAGKARELAAMLRAAKQEGRFAAATTPEAFSAALTEAMQQVSPDLHLRMDYEPAHEFAPDADGGEGRQVQRRDDSGATRMVRRTARIDPRSEAEIARSNFGVEAVEHLEGNIGYLRLSRFVPADLSRETLRAAIALIAHSDAVIIDLRRNIGGAPNAVGELLSPFYPAAGGPVLLHASENRAMGIRDAINTDPAQSREGLAKAPLYILVGERTASAAEIFAYAARRTGRATLVGTRTAGAGNGASRHSVGDGFALFLSEWRVLTGPGWERVGVAPDVDVPSDRALERALELARERMGTATPPPAG